MRTWQEKNLDDWLRKNNLTTDPRMLSGQWDTLTIEERFQAIEREDDEWWLEKRRRDREHAVFVQASRRPREDTPSDRALAAIFLLLAIQTWHR